MVRPQDINWTELEFKFTATDFMYVAHYNKDDVWRKGKLEPFGNISLSPAACVLNYGQGLFEGLKAYRSTNNKEIFLFRPLENARRMRDGCIRLCIPPITDEVFMDGVISATKANKDFIPPYRENSPTQGALYLRPIIFGSGPLLGVGPAPSYMFVVFACPVGPYFKSGFQPIKLKISRDFHRAASGGTGAVKAIGNYSVGMYPAQMAKKEGYQEILYVDAKESEFLEEVGAANFFCIKGNTLLTPELNGCILPGVTRASILQLAKDKLKMNVEERKIRVDEVLNVDEAFSCGTGVVLSVIGSICADGKEKVINKGEPGPISRKLYQLLLSIQHGAEPDPYGWRYPVV